MRTEITPDNLEDFKKRFGIFHDAVIHSIEYGIFSHKNPKIVTVKVGTRDLQFQSPDNWINVTFQVEPVVELIVRQARNYTLGVIFGLSIEFFDQEVYLDFKRGSEKPTGPEDYERDPLGSHLLIVGKKLFWSTEPYQER
ncbi:MAG: hypothetical protein K8L97_11855 [Anaerolineae bacterium]|nr:hypothetical protein [Anaerolineae bacterium]